MIRVTKILTWIMISFMFLGLFAGYANVVETLIIDGSVSVENKPYEGVYIYAVEFVSENGARHISCDYSKPTNFSQTASASRTGGTVTYKITVHNNTNVTYWYLGQEYVDELESNSLIGTGHGITVTTKDHASDTTSTFNDADWIPANTYRDFYVTYSYGSDAQLNRSTYINFNFGIKIDAINDQFVAVLNNVLVEKGYEYLSEAFDDKYAKTGGTVLANVGAEEAIFNKLFGANLTVNVDGNDVPVTVVVERKDVDGRATGDDYSGNGAPTECEYTVYITVDNLKSGSGKATVYAVSYTCNGTASSTGEWYQIGQLYEGTANIIDYDSKTEGVQGAIDVSSWIAVPKKYEVGSNISYLVGQEQGDQYDKLKELSDIMSTNDQDIFNDIDNSGILMKVYAIVYNSANYNKAGYENLKTAFENAKPFYNVMNNGQEVKVKRNCTRAEIIPFIEKIQNAFDYYNQVN